MDHRELRALLMERRTIGALCVIPSPVVAEAMGHAGLDWVCIDRQHGLIGFETMVGMIQALSLTATPAFVRVPGNSPSEIGRALDAGASGVIVPMVNAVDDAVRAIHAARYAPRGERSWGAVRGSFDGGRPARADGLVLAMLETASAFDQASDILAVDGLDGVLIGTADLAVSMGLPPEESLHPAIVARCEAIVPIALERGIALAIGAHSIEAATAWSAMGYRMLSVGRDITFLLAGLRARVEPVRRLAR